MTPERSFDPQSPGARRLARGWLATRERWLVRIVGTPFIDPDGCTRQVGDTVELSARDARMVLEDGGAELVATRIASVDDAA